MRDLYIVEDDAGHRSYMLRVPRAKQRGRRIRDSFKVRPLHKDIGAAVHRHVSIMRSAFDGILPDPGNAPMFATESDDLIFADGFEFHATSRVIANRVKNTLESLKVKSERAEKLINITTTRSRRTLGTNAAREGHSVPVIADLLDHTDTQNAGIYVEATPEIIDRIDRAVALRLAPLAQAFAGRIVLDELDTERGDDPSSRIADPRLDSERRPVGNCGKHGACHLPCPIACYTCGSFNALFDGPHEAVLEHLLTERERLMKAGDKRIATVNDRTICAVAEVVRICEEMRSAGEEAFDG